MAMLTSQSCILLRRATLRKVVAAPQPKLASGVATAAGVEIAQLAGEAGFIAGTAFTMMGITLVVSTTGWGDGWERMKQRVGRRALTTLHVLCARRVWPSASSCCAWSPWWRRASCKLAASHVPCSHGVDRRGSARGLLPSRHGVPCAAPQAPHFERFCNAEVPRMAEGPATSQRRSAIMRWDAAASSRGTAGAI